MLLLFLGQNWVWYNPLAYSDYSDYFPDLSLISTSWYNEVHHVDDVFIRQAQYMAYLFLLYPS